MVTAGQPTTLAVWIPEAERVVMPGAGHIATTNNCFGNPAKVCCPTGTTCTTEGTCLID